MLSLSMSFSVVIPRCGALAVPLGRRHRVSGRRASYRYWKYPLLDTFTSIDQDARRPIWVLF